MLGLLGQSWFGLIRPLRNIPIVWISLKWGGIITTTRNGVFEGALFVGIGMLFAQKRIVMKFKYAVIGFFGAMLFLFAETVFVRYLDFCYVGTTSMYICLVPAVFFCFI